MPGSQPGSILGVGRGVVEKPTSRSTPGGKLNGRGVVSRVAAGGSVALGVVFWTTQASPGRFPSDFGQGQRHPFPASMGLQQQQRLTLALWAGQAETETGRADALRTAAAEITRAMFRSKLIA